MDNYFNEAIKLASDGVRRKDGGPFGAVIVNKNGEIVGYGNNKVLVNNDPTAHAEVVAIRDACKRLNTYNLDGCCVYTTSEPCPMCISALIWANIKKVYYATNRTEVAKIGFRDEMIYNYLEKKEREIIHIQEVQNKACNDLLNNYQNTIY